MQVLTLKQHDDLLNWLSFPAEVLAKRHGVPEWVIQELQKGKRLR